MERPVIPRSLPDKEGEPPHRLALTFSGQGTQKVGMADEALALSPDIFRPLFKETSEVIGEDLVKVCRDEEKLKKRTQVAILAVNQGNLLLFERAGVFDNYRVVVGGGNSLGEYNTLIAAGVLTFQEGVNLVMERENAMLYACQTVEGGGLAAFRNQHDETLARTHHVALALHNSPEQFIYGGTKGNLKAFAKAIGEPYKELPVAGPYHTFLMESAVPLFAPVVRRTAFRNPQFPVVANTTSKFMTNSEEIPEELIQQLTNTVRWHDNSLAIDHFGVDATAEAGDKEILTRIEQKRLSKANIPVVKTAITIAVGTAVITAGIILHRHYQEDK